MYTPYMQEEYTIARVTPQDFSTIVALDRIGNPQSAWVEDDYERIISANLCHIWGAYHANTLIAYIAVFLLVDIYEVISIITHEAHQRKGIGRRLLYTVIKEAYISGLVKEIHLEVRCSNIPARSLYQKVGFIEQGIRKQYYSHPREDGILYSYPITSSCL